MLQDLRYAFRTFAKNPGFTAPLDPVVFMLAPMTLAAAAAVASWLPARRATRVAPVTALRTE